MASASLAEGAHVPVAATAVRAELTRADGAPGARGAALGTLVPAILLTAGGRAAGGGAAGGGPAAGAALDLRTLPPDVVRVLFRIPAADRAPGLLLRLLRASDATELASLAFAPGTASEGGELHRAEHGIWHFRAAPPAPGGNAPRPLPATAQEVMPLVAAREAIPPVAVQEMRPAAVAQETAAPVVAPPEAIRPAAAREEPRVPAQAAAPASESLTPPLRGRLSLRCEQAAVSLLKYGAAEARARVVLVLDASASMSGLYAGGVVADVVERTAAVAALLADGRMAAWTFASHPARLPDCTVEGLPGWLRLHVRPGQLALLGRPRRRTRGLHPDQTDMRCVGVRNEEHKAIAQVRAYVRDRPVSVPTLVVFLSGGGVHRDAEIERQLAEGADEPLFWQFVGLGRAADYGVLPRLGAPEGGRLGNTGFFAVDDVARTSDAELYDRLLCTFPAWLASARRAGVLE